MQSISVQELTNGSVVFERGCCGVEECFKGQGTGCWLIYHIKEGIQKNFLRDIV